MIIIISESLDKSTENVIDWIEHYGSSSIRKNYECDFQNFFYSISSKKIENTFIKNVVWNRRGYLSIIPNKLKNTDWFSYLNKEQLPVLFAFEYGEKSNFIGSYKKEIHNNKIINLQIALDVGFKIPETFITNNKTDLIRFVDKSKIYITKSLFQSPNIKIENLVYSGVGTNILNMNSVSEFFAPSLVQEYIEKEIEIRIFFIKKSYYAMAIFSQSDEKTKIDFRNYNEDRPNRSIPFILPPKILLKIKTFIKKMKLDTGSIDLILTPEGEYFFLEINPMGQYDWLSKDCNYYIDKKIAEILITEDIKNIKKDKLI